MTSHSSSSGIRYVVALVALVLATALSAVLAHVPLGPFSSLVAFGIAAIKALIVAAVFMELTEAPFTQRFIAAVTVTFIFLLCLGIALDVAYR